MIIFDLICSDRHIFEGWFSSSGDYEAQSCGNLLSCPMCGSSDISKSIMAPNIGLKSNQKLVKPASTNTNKTDDDIKSDHITGDMPSNAPAKDASDKQKQLTSSIEVAARELAKLQKSVLQDSTWVGGKFAQEARAIHYGETDKRQIHGHTSENEAAELQNEGIDIAALPMPIIPPDLKN